MRRQFNTPDFFESSFVSTIKKRRQADDTRKRDLIPSEFSFGRVQFKLARHFGFCYGVENAIDIAYKALRENPGRRIFLLSEMIHNPTVNQNLVDNGVRFILRHDGKQLTDFNELTPEDI